MIKWSISRYRFSIELESQVLDSIKIKKKQRINFYDTLLTIKRHKKLSYGPFYGYKFSIENSVLLSGQFTGVHFQMNSKAKF